MEPWKIAIIIAAVAVVLIVGGVALAILRASNTPMLIEQSASASLFSQSGNIAQGEQRFIEATGFGVVIVNREGVVTFANDGDGVDQVVSGQRLTQSDVREILALVAADGTVREREIQVQTGAAAAASGRGVQAGQTQPSNVTYLKVRVGALDDGLYAIVMSDMSEQRRFEQLRDDYVTDVSHELKTPAGAIALLAETVNDAADDPEAVRYFSGRITKESSRLTELVQHLIALQKAQGAADTSRVVTDAARIACEAIEANRVQAADHHIAVTLSVNGKPVADDDEVDGPVIDANAESMVVAVKNLVENAIHYSPANTTVVVGVAEADGKVTIRVVDQGEGIPAESLDRVFERFYRVDAARSRETGGSGLGLAIARACVESNGGTIAVWSREGEGSTFTIELPAAKATAHNSTQSEEHNLEEQS